MFKRCRLSGLSNWVAAGATARPAPRWGLTFVYRDLVSSAMMRVPRALGTVRACSFPHHAHRAGRFRAVVGRVGPEGPPRPAAQAIDEILLLMSWFACIGRLRRTTPLEQWVA
jgi:hypothetical protein